MAVEINRIIEGYLALRNQKEELARKQKEEIAPLTKKLDKLENYLRAYLQTSGLTSVGDKEIGTAFLETRVEAKVADWSAVLAWIQETNAWEFLERRVSKGVVKDYIEAHREVPPGIAVEREIVCRVRKS
jgi:phage host-nuclease inhibitor protein Gam